MRLTAQFDNHIYICSMFHWICPECGREIAPQAKECSACDPTAAAAAKAAQEKAPEASAKAVPQKTFEEKAPEAPAPIQPRVSGAPKAPASALPAPVPAAGRDLAPVETATVAAQPPDITHSLPEPQPARAPQITNAPLREPQPAALASSTTAHDLSAGPELGSTATVLPAIHAGVPGPPLAPFVDYAKIATSKIRPAEGKAGPAGKSVQEQISLPGPTLPHELTSLHAAGIAKVLVQSERAEAPARRSSSWMLSFTVAAAVIAGTLGAAFYAIPGLANSPTPTKQVVAKAIKDVPEPPKPAAPINPLARVVEVTGVRFVTDIPGQPPQIHYLVVNHGNLPLVGLTVMVTLRPTTGESDAPLSQFTFKAPRLAPYEAKEMVSSIERFSSSVTVPGWRDLRADIQVGQ